MGFYVWIQWVSILALVVIFLAARYRRRAKEKRYQREAEIEEEKTEREEENRIKLHRTNGRGDQHHGFRTCLCGSFLTLCDKHYALYCWNCNQWTEGKCAPREGRLVEDDCQFCKDRPELPREEEKTEAA